MMNRGIEGSRLRENAAEEFLHRARDTSGGAAGETAKKSSVGG